MRSSVDFTCPVDATGVRTFRIRALLYAVSTYLVFLHQPIISLKILSAVHQHQSLQIQQATFFNRCFSVHFDKHKAIFANKCTVY